VPEEHVIETVEVKAVEGGRYREVYLNGEPVDLAYVFVEQGPSEFKNLSKLAKCKSTGVSESIRTGKPSASTSVKGGGAGGFPGKYALAFGRSTLVVAADSMGTGYVVHLELHGDKGEQVVIGGPLDEQGPEPRLLTPLGSCALIVTYDEKRDAVRLKSEPACRGLLQSAEGLYTRAADDDAKR